MENERMQKWDTNEDFDKKCLVLFHFMKRYPYKSKNPECSWAKSIKLFMIITRYGI